jgi:hypothetical protein
MFQALTDYANAGTSLATALIAGLVAAAQQGQQSPFGFMNPLLYRLAGTPALYDILPATAALPPPGETACFRCGPSAGSWRIFYDMTIGWSRYISLRRR